MNIGQSDCERIADATLAQPVLALTSVAYVVAGLIALYWALRGRAALGVAGGLLLVAVGVGSFAYHGPQPSWAPPAHDWPIIALGVVCAIGLARSGIRRQWSAWTIPAVIFALGLVAYAAGRTGSPLCSPESWWQFHGVWHIVSAAAGLAAARVMVGQPVSAWRRGS